MYILLILIGLVSLLVLVGCFGQERLIFYPEKLSANHVYRFKGTFEDLQIAVDDRTQLNGLLFTVPNPKGLVFYLHGNAGSLDGWGEIAPIYTRRGYDFFILDYRGFGKSQGRISDELQLYSDLQIVYDTLKLRYPEAQTTVIGYSIGSGLATYLASKNHPRQLILQAPYYSLTNLAKHYFPLIPSWMLRYKIPTFQYLESLPCPVTIFHGTADRVIYYQSSQMLAKHFRQGDRLVTLQGEVHNGVNVNPIFQAELADLLP